MYFGSGREKSIRRPVFGTRSESRADPGYVWASPTRFSPQGPLWW
jgi:hypothetical protein